MDDKIFKFVLYAMVAISAVVIIGIWEQLIQPLIIFLMGNVNIII
ncbi:MAG TPA: hypothetical protein VJB67_02935 [Patescibacteria group bacterium]|nr:hypothetical protein [Patescibacteria group bacterium]